MRVFKWAAPISVFCLIIFLATAKISDSDTPQYLASGKYILAHGLPNGCVFTYTVEQCIVVYSEWLLHLIAYGIFVLSGYHGLSLFTAIIISLIFLVVFIFSREKGIDPIISSAILLLISYVSLYLVGLPVDLV